MKMLHRIIEAGTPERPFCGSCGRRIHRTVSFGWRHDQDSTWTATGRWHHLDRERDADHRPRPGDDSTVLSCRSCGNRIEKVHG